MRKWKTPPLAARCGQCQRNVAPTQFCRRCLGMPEVAVSPKIPGQPPPVRRPAKRRDVDPAQEAAPAPVGVHYVNTAAADRQALNAYLETLRAIEPALATQAPEMPDRREANAAGYEIAPLHFPEDY